MKKIKKNNLVAKALESIRNIDFRDDDANISLILYNIQKCMSVRVHLVKRDGRNVRCWLCLKFPFDIAVWMARNGKMNIIKYFYISCDMRTDRTPLATHSHTHTHDAHSTSRMFRLV